MRDIISEICSYHCGSNVCYKEKCERGKWCKPLFDTRGLPQIGKDKECPIMQFEAEQLPELKGDFLSRPRPEHITIDDTWDICEACKFSTVTEDEISLGDSFYTHCMDCIVHDIRDSIQECYAEAMES